MFVLYTKSNCIFCTKAKELLNQKGFIYEERQLNVDISPEELMAMYPGWRTLPIIIAGNEFVGGFKQLEERFNALKENADKQFLQE